MTLPHNEHGDRFLSASSIGARDEQQDASVCFSSSEHGSALLVVSDGVGGKSGGRIASQKVIELAKRLWEERAGQLSDPYGDLMSLCRIAHDQINDEGVKRGVSPRATIIALYLTPTHAHWVYSGDSRLYHFRDRQLLKRTEDHSVLQIMVQRGLVNEEDMGSHPDQGTLLQSLGGEDYKEPSRASVEITPHDAFLLCTDGFWERLPLEEMIAVAYSPRSNAQQLLQRAVDRAVKLNGAKSDNVTAIIALPFTEDASANRESIPAAPLRFLPLFILLTAAALLVGIVVTLSLFYFMRNLTPSADSTVPAPSAGVRRASSPSEEPDGGGPK